MSMKKQRFLHPPVDCSNDRIMVRENLRPAPLVMESKVKRSETERKALIKAKFAYDQAKKNPVLFKEQVHDFVRNIINSQTPNWGSIRLNLTV